MFTSINEFREGKVLLLNKPLKWTSFDVVNKIKWKIKWAQRQLDPTQKSVDIKVGHAGTLDPLATGLLLVCTGKFTKEIDKLQAKEKEYTGTFFIGATTPCFDLEKEIDHHYPTEHITPELILEKAKTFIGEQQQVPPLYSAIKIKGTPAYELARAGKTAEIKPKTITISEFDITRNQLPEIDVRVVCSKGTYIRALARDLGLALNSGAHLTALCRTRIGNYLNSNAISPEAFEIAIEQFVEKEKASIV